MSKKTLTSFLSEVGGYPLTESSEASLGYANHSKAVMSYLNQLGQLVSAHSVEQAKNPTNWGFVGDMETVSEDLKKIVEYLSTWVETAKE